MSRSNWRALYPFQSNHLLLDGVRYHYLDEGEGEVLLLVHGNPTWSFYWRELIRCWRKRYRVIAIDHIGCGLSDKPANYSYRLAQHIRNLNCLGARIGSGRHHLGCPRLGRGDRHRRGGSRSGAIRSIRDAEYRRISLATNPLANPDLPNADFRPASRSRRQCLCTRGSIHGRL